DALRRLWRGGRQRGPVGAAAVGDAELRQQRTLKEHEMNQVWWGKEADFWRGLGSSAQSALAGRGTTRTWAAKTSLLAQGDEEGIIILHQGRVRLVSPRGGERELTLARLGAGEVLGRATWLQDGVAGAFAVVTEEASGWHLDRDALEKLLRDAPE